MSQTALIADIKAMKDLRFKTTNLPRKIRPNRLILKPRTVDPVASEEDDEMAAAASLAQLAMKKPKTDPMMSVEIQCTCEKCTEAKAKMDEAFARKLWQ